MIKRFLSFLVLFIMFNYLNAQESPENLLKKISEKYEQIKDYSVLIHVSVNLPGFRMPDKSIRFFYKAPDKTKLETKGFAVVPKDGLFLRPERFMDEGVELKMERYEEKEGVKFSVLKVIPPVEKGPRPDIYLWIDMERMVISEMITDFGKENRLRMKIKYQEIEGFWMPETTKFEMTYRGNFKDLMAKPGTHNLEALSDRSEVNNGEILITFKEFELNQGLDDSIFENEWKSEED